MIHLGDYIYEYGKGGERASQPKGILHTLHDYRPRHGQYRTDPDLQLLDLIMLDTRNYDRSITSLDWNDHYLDLIRDDPSRTLMGSRQNWFYRSLSQSQ